MGILLPLQTIPLRVRNHALGYDITVYLKEFRIYDSYLKTDATSQFKVLSTDDSDLRRHWQRERKRAYRGSFRHFIHTLANGSAYKEGFRILFTTEKRIYPYNNARPDPSRNRDNRMDQVKMNPDQINDYWYYRRLGEIRLTTKEGYNFWEVVYLNEHPERPVSRMIGLEQFHASNFMSRVSFIELPHDEGLVDTRTALGIPPQVPVTYGYWGWSSCIPEWLPKNYQPAQSPSS